MMATPGPAEIRKLYNLDSFFPKEKYGKGMNKNLVLHYHILYGMTKEAAVWLKTNQQWAMYQEPLSFLTPLHLCSIFGNNEIAQQLLGLSTVSVAVKDVRNWTPLHHAALRENAEMLDLLLLADLTKKCGAAAILNRNNGTYEDLRRMAFPAKIASEETNPGVFNYLNLTGQIVSGSEADFQKLAGASFARHMHASSVFFMNEWARPAESKKIHNEFKKELGVECESFSHHKPKIYMAKTAVGFGVFAGEDIPAFSIVTDYLGEACNDNVESQYAIELCDGVRIRNLGPVINDGFPNCVDFPIPNVQGYPIVTVIRSIRSIKFGEQILFNYGTHHPVKRGKYIDLADPSSVKEWGTTTLEKRMSEMLQTNGLMNRSLFTPIHYFLGTQAALIKYMFEKAISVRDFGNVLAKLNDSVFFIRRDLEECRVIVKSLFKLCEEDGYSLEVVKTFVSELFENYTSSVVIKILIALVNPEPTFNAYLRSFVKTYPAMKNEIFQLAMHLEVVETLYSSYRENSNPAIISELAQAFMNISGPLAPGVLTTNFIWPLRALSIEDTDQKQKYLSLIQIEGLKSHLEGLGIEYYSENDDDGSGE